MTATATTTSEASPSTEGKRSKTPPVSLGEVNESILARLKVEVKAPGTELGLLARGIETVLRDLQARLNERGEVHHVKTILGASAETDIKAMVGFDFHLFVGEHARTYAFNVMPQGLYVPVSPSADASSSAPSASVGVDVTASITRKDIGPVDDPTATSNPAGIGGPGPAGLGSEDLHAVQH